MSNTKFIDTVIKNSGNALQGEFFPSKNVSVFPCWYRGTYTDGDKKKIYDPEARLGETENNKTRSYPRVVGKECYLASYYNEDSSTKVFEVSMSGYYFKIETDTDLKNKVLVIRTSQSDIVTGEKDQRKTRILASLTSDKAGATLDALQESNSYFTGICLMTKSDYDGATSKDGCISFSFVDVSGAKIFGAKPLDALVQGGSSDYSFRTIHENTEVAGENSLAIGQTVKTEGNTSISIGSNISTDGNTSIVLGDSNSSTGDVNFVVGKSNTVSGNNIIAIGENIKATASYPANMPVIRLGKYNADSEKDIIQIGNGTSSANSNLLSASEDSLKISSKNISLEQATSITAENLENITYKDFTIDTSNGILYKTNTFKVSTDGTVKASKSFNVGSTTIENNKITMIASAAENQSTCVIEPSVIEWKKIKTPNLEVTESLTAKLDVAFNSVNCTSDITTKGNVSAKEVSADSANIGGAKFTYDTANKVLTITLG